MRALLILFLAAGAAHADWEKFANEDGVLVEWRKVEGSRVREIRASGEIDQPLAKLVAALRDLEHFAEFMPPTESVVILSRTPLRLHVTINPALVSRRDYCLDVTWQISATEAVSRWTQVADGCPPPKKGVVRHRRTDGSWHLRALDGGRTFVEYQAITDPGGSIPAWIVDRAGAKTLKSMYRALAQHAASMR